MKQFKDMSFTELRDLAKMYYHDCFVSECYRTKELQAYNACCYELLKRGYVADERHTKVVFKRN